MKLPKSGTRYLKEFEAGKQSGMFHNNSDPLHRENLRKMESGVQSDQILVRAYWKGYRTGLEIR